MEKGGEIKEGEMHGLLLIGREDFYYCIYWTRCACMAYSYVCSLA